MAFVVQHILGGAPQRQRVLGYQNSNHSAVTRPSENAKFRKSKTSLARLNFPCIQDQVVEFTQVSLRIKGHLQHHPTSPNHQLSNITTLRYQYHRTTTPPHQQQVEVSTYLRFMNTPWVLGSFYWSSICRV